MPPLSLLITGGSSGLGLGISLAGLKAGHKVVATSRDPVQAAAAHPQLEQLGGRWIQLDVDQSSATETVAQAVKEHDVNVLVNNAGYGLLGSFEDTGEGEFAAQLNTNIFGPYRTIRGALPHFRSLQGQGGATIVNVGSIVTFAPYPGCSAYTASKCALEGLSEVLATEVGPYGVRTILIDLGIFRTSFLKHTTEPSAGLDSAYVGGPVDKTVAFLQGLDGKQPGDPASAARRIVEVIEGSGIAAKLGLNDKGFGSVLRVPLGTDVADAAESCSEAIAALHNLRQLATSTDYPEDSASTGAA
ncbi:hypothetical protein EsDP_00006462 [Epichloe bromicola]|uniref:Short chain oxidoreductase/dehydrogenase n=1 Tax=Epichloe bromicola TaxID=79588 RepID=A0ABQ0CXQ2_9HYPO